MITRRGFFGTVAALVVGGGAARLVLTPQPGTWASIERSTFPAWRAQVPTSTRALDADVFRPLYEQCSRESIIGGLRGGGKPLAMAALADEWVRGVQ